MSSETAELIDGQVGVVPRHGAQGAPRLGAEITGVDLRSIDETAFAAIHRAWIDHQVLLFRGQHLTDLDLIAFCRRFGDLDHAPIQENGQRFVNGLPEIYVVSNVIENGVAIGSLGDGEAVWHTDMSYLTAPPKASMLYALEIPPAAATPRSATCTRHSRRCRNRCGNAPWACGSSTTAPTTAAAMSGRA